MRETWVAVCTVGMTLLALAAFVLGVAAEVPDGSIRLDVVNGSVEP